MIYFVMVEMVHVEIYFVYMVYFEILRYILSWFIWYILRFQILSWFRWYILGYILSWFRRHISRFWDKFRYGSDGTFGRMKRLEPSKNFWLLRKAMNWFMPAVKGNTNTEMSGKKSGGKVWRNTNVNLEEFYLWGGCLETKSCAPTWKMTLCQIPRWSTIIQKLYMKLKIKLEIKWKCIWTVKLEITLCKIPR